MNLPPKVRTEPTAGFAYLISGPDGLYKIGHSVSPEKRLQQIAPKRFGLALLAAVPTASPRELEGWLHDAFAHRRVSGEWFMLSEEEVSLIRSIPTADTLADLPAAVLALRQVNEASGFTWGGRGVRVTVPAHRQFVCRPDAEIRAAIERVRGLAGQLLPVRITDAELLRLGMEALEEKLAAKVAELKGKGGKKS